MEFLAESIGLLDLDSASRPYVTSSTPDAETHSPNERNSTNSRLFGWFDGNAADGEVMDKKEETDGSKLNETKDSDHCKTDPHEVAMPQSPRSCEEDDLEQFLFHDNSSNNNNDDSFTSLLSSLSPDTPLTLSASDLFRSQTLNEREPTKDEDATLTMNNNTRASATNPILTKTTIHRLSSQGCFSGNIDALTGHPLHGTFIAKNGYVYEGPFTTIGEQSVRHGRGECTYPTAQGSMKFVGRYEYDLPRWGIWFGEGWVYEGDLAECREETTVSLAGGSLETKVIGITSPLPDNVLFNGTGKFMKANGYVYQGEFMSGLASGVGKEILSNGSGVYYGEFWEGLRHGVGTLIEYFSDNDEIDATKDSIDIDDEEHECLQSCSWVKKVIER